MNSKPPRTKLPKGGCQNYPEEENGIKRNDYRADDHACGGKRLSAVLLRRLFDLREGNEAEHDCNNGRNRTETAGQHEPGDGCNHRRQRETLIRLGFAEVW